MATERLHWLAKIGDWRAGLAELGPDPVQAWPQAVRLANAPLDFLQENALDRRLRQLLPAAPAGLASGPVRLAVLGSATVSHLLASIRVAGLRRGLWVDTHACGFDQFRQDLADPGSALHAFEPTVVLFALDAWTLTQGIDPALDAAGAQAALDDALAGIRGLWRQARAAWRCPLIQQAVLPVHLPLMGNNEFGLPGSRAGFVTRLNAGLRALAAEEDVDLLAIDDWAARDGIDQWHDGRLWLHARQEIAPPAAPVYADLVGRLLVARLGRSAKCLVLDLDNTLWGGVVGDDGLDGLELGQGSPVGEAYQAFQHFVRELSRRGVILAVCSRNDEALALQVFDQHPGMLLSRDDIACFVANWADKPANLRMIARRLGIGLESLVFVDDSPFERELVRAALPMVAVPELPDDPLGYPRTLAQGGYFESVCLTAEDRLRNRQYRARDAALSAAPGAGLSTDLPAYLRGLRMQLSAKPFDRTGLPRIAQLIGKSNQFNLTGRRYGSQDLLALIDDPRIVSLQLRLVDRLGDQGVIALVIGRQLDHSELLIDGWWMSCRVIGRQVEAATLALLVQQAQRLGATRLLGDYLPTGRNGLVADLYARLGFTQDGRRWVLALADYRPAELVVAIDGDARDA